MKRSRRSDEALWAVHNAEWRSPAQIASWWEEAKDTDPLLLQARAHGEFWSLLEERGVSLVVSREYEHLLVALSASDGRRQTSFMRVPHPSGIAFDRRGGSLFVASTRNPNQVLELRPRENAAGVLMPSRSWFLPGSLYIHDIAMIGGKLHANAVGMNAVVEIEEGCYRPVWWPKSVEDRRGPRFDRNYLQLNSIAAGASLRDSYFTASLASPGARRPGHLNFPVDRRGVLFSGRSREPVCGGLTRPHSARLHEGAVWLDNSGYGEVGFWRPGDRSFTTAQRLPGWTRGLAIHRGIAFVGTSRVIPRFARYAPGLDLERAVCGVHAMELRTGRVLGSLVWPHGNQVFAIECVPAAFARRLPFAAGRRASEAEKRLFFERPDA